MLRITIPATEQWDEQNQEFVYSKEQTLQLEHSLVSISKWEAKWNKAFLSKNDKTDEEVLDYIRCMTLTQNVSPDTYRCLTNKNIDQVNEYINAPMTATYFSNNKAGSPNRELYTSEVIYSQMIMLNIPFECQKWHLNRLLTLIRVCVIKSSPQKKMSRREIIERNNALNEARRKQLNTKG